MHFLPTLHSTFALNAGDNQGSGGSEVGFQDVGFRGWGLGCGVWGLGLRVSGTKRFQIQSFLFSASPEHPQASNPIL